MSSRPFLSLALALALAALTGCASSGTARHASPFPSQLTVAPSYPYEIRYEILGVATGKACKPAKKSSGAFGAAVGEPGTVGSPDLYQEAKYLAIESVPQADNLLFIRAKVEENDGEECITVTGRAYRVTGLHAHGCAHAPATSSSSPRLTPEAVLSDRSDD